MHYAAAPRQGAFQAVPGNHASSMILLIEGSWLQLQSEKIFDFASLFNIYNVEETKALVTSFNKGRLVHIKIFFFFFLFTKQDKFSLVF